MVLTLTLLPGLGSVQLLSFAIPFSVFLILLGLFWRDPETGREEIPSESKAGVASWLRFGGLVLAICAGVFVFSHQYELSYAYAVTLSCLGAVLGARVLAWSRRQNPPMSNMANVSNELAIVGGSAFIGSVISGVVLGQISGNADLPAWSWPILAAGVPWVYFLAGLGGVNPIVVGTLIGGILGSLWPAPALIGLGIGMVTGWGITAFGTPFAANALIMERLTGYPAVDASFRWSLPLSLSGLTLASLTAGILTAWLA